MLDKNTVIVFFQHIFYTFYFVSPLRPLLLPHNRACVLPETNSSDTQQHTSRQKLSPIGHEALLPSHTPDIPSSLTSDLQHPPPRKFWNIIDCRKSEDV